MLVSCMVLWIYNFPCPHTSRSTPNEMLHPSKSLTNTMLTYRTEEDMVLVALGSPLKGDSDLTQELNELDSEEPGSPILHTSSEACEYLRMNS